MLFRTDTPLTLACSAALFALGCGTNTTATADAGADTSVTDAPAGSAQLPPLGRVAVEAWIASGAYRAWHCETAPHPARMPSPHGVNRICSNDALSATASGEYPVGAAAV